VAEIKYFQRVGGLVRLKPNASINEFTHYRDPYPDDPDPSFEAMWYYRYRICKIEQEWVGLYVKHVTANKHYVDCHVLLFENGLIAIPSMYTEEWFEAI